MTTLIAPISYLASVTDGEKPYNLMYGETDGAIPRTNIRRQWHDTCIHDIRTANSKLSFQESGVTIVQHEDSNMIFEDYFNDYTVSQVYYRELQAILKHLLGASKVLFFRHGVRKRHPTFPVVLSSGKVEEYQYSQPTAQCHVDATLDTTQEEISKQLGDDATYVLANKRFQWVNVWRPLRRDGSVTNDWPLAVVDASTLDPSDAEATDMVYTDYFTENLNYRYNAKQKWYYLSDHRPDELIVFKQSDSDPVAVPGVPHCSFQNPLASPNEPPRESIEARALVIY